MAGTADGRREHNLNTARGRRAAAGLDADGKPDTPVWVPLETRKWRWIEHYGFHAYANSHWRKYTSDGVIPFAEFLRGEAYLDGAGEARGNLQMATAVALGAAIAMVGDDPKVSAAVERLERAAHPTLTMDSADGGRIEGR